MKTIARVKQEFQKAPSPIVTNLFQIREFSEEPFYVHLCIFRLNKKWRGGDKQLWGKYLGEN